MFKSHFHIGNVTNFVNLSVVVIDWNVVVRVFDLY
jgi:hypothetical protein